MIPELVLPLCGGQVEGKKERKIVDTILVLYWQMSVFFETL